MPTPIGPSHRDVLKRHGWWAPARPTGACYLNGKRCRCRSREARRKGRTHPFLQLAFALFPLTAACASAPPAASPAGPLPVSEIPVVSWEEKLGWMVRLEDQRLLRDPNTPPPAILRPATKTEPAIVTPPRLRSDPLAGDSEARTRRRAALAGAGGLSAAVEPLTRLLATRNSRSVRWPPSRWGCWPIHQPDPPAEGARRCRTDRAGTRGRSAGCDR